MRHPGGRVVKALPYLSSLAQHTWPNEADETKIRQLRPHPTLIGKVRLVPAHLEPPNNGGMRKAGLQAFFKLLRERA